MFISSRSFPSCVTRQSEERQTSEGSVWPIGVLQRPLEPRQPSPGRTTLRSPGNTAPSQQPRGERAVEVRTATLLVLGGITVKESYTGFLLVFLCVCFSQLIHTDTPKWKFTLSDDTALHYHIVCPIGVCSNHCTQNHDQLKFSKMITTSLL